METLLSSPFHPALKTVPGDRHYYLPTPWNDVAFARPKLIVAVSLTPTSDRVFRDNPLVFPAILDTGFNRTLEIHESHIKKCFPKQKGFVPLTTITNRQGKDCFELSLHIWLQSVPYLQANHDPQATARLLGQSKTVHVVKDDGKAVWPPLPLIGLEFLVANNLNLSIEAASKRFSITSL